MAAKKINPLIAELQIKEGLAVRKVKGSLKVVPARGRKAAIVEKEKNMPKQINISIHPFGSAREQLWIGKIVDGEFTKAKPLYKVSKEELPATSRCNGKFGNASTSQEWEITVPDNFPHAIARSKWSDPTFVRRHIEYEVIYTPVA